MLIEVFTLELDDMPDQQFSILIGHPDEATVEAIRVEWVGNGINIQHFQAGLKVHLFWKEQGARENVVGLKKLVDHQADAAGAQIDGLLDRYDLRAVALRLKADGQGNSDAIKLAAICRRWLWGRGVCCHGTQEYIKKGKGQLGRSSVLACLHRCGWI